MAKQRPEKKSETLEVRLPHSKKEAFKAACEEEGITASHAVRTFIDAYLKRSRRVKLKRIAEDITMKLFRNPLKTTGIAGTGLIAAFLFGASPSAADTDPFTQLDKNGDGYLSAADSAFIAGFFERDTEALAADVAKAFPGAEIASVGESPWTSADTNGDKRISPEEFATLNVVTFTVEDEIDNLPDLPQTEDGTTEFIFVGPSPDAIPDGVMLDEAHFREALEDGEITWTPNEDGSGKMTIRHKTEPESDTPTP